MKPSNKDHDNVGVNCPDIDRFCSPYRAWRSWTVLRVSTSSWLHWPLTCSDPWDTADVPGIWSKHKLKHYKWNRIARFIDKNQNNKKLLLTGCNVQCSVKGPWGSCHLRCQKWKQFRLAVRVSKEHHSILWKLYLACYFPSYALASFLSCCFFKAVRNICVPHNVHSFALIELLQEMRYEYLLSFCCRQTVDNYCAIQDFAVKLSGWIDMVMASWQQTFQGIGLGTWKGQVLKLWQRWWKGLHFMAEELFHISITAL